VRTTLGEFINPIIEPEYVGEDLSDRDIEGWGNLIP
jgi:hypothetical protein